MAALVPCLKSYSKTSSATATPTHSTLTNTGHLWTRLTATASSSTTSISRIGKEPRRLARRAVPLKSYARTGHHAQKSRLRISPCGLRVGRASGMHAGQHTGLGTVSMTRAVQPLLMLLQPQRYALHRPAIRLQLWMPICRLHLGLRLRFLSLLFLLAFTQVLRLIARLLVVARCKNDGNGQKIWWIVSQGFFFIFFGLYSAFGKEGSWLEPHGSSHTLHPQTLRVISAKSVYAFVAACFIATIATLERPIE